MAETFGEYHAIPVILSFEGVDKQVNNSLGKSFKTAGAKGSKEFGKEFAGNAEADIKRLGDSYTKVYDRMKDSAGKLRAEEAKLQDLRDKGVSGGRLIAQTERAEKARRDEARAVRDATGAYKDLEDAQKKLDSGSGGGGGFLSKLKDAASGAGSAGSEAASGFLEGFGGPIAELGTKAGPIGAALAAAAAVALGAGGLIATQVMAGIEKEAQSDKIQATFGFDDATMAKIADSSGKAYADNFGESINANMSGAAAAIQNGLVAASSSGDQIQGTVEKLSTVSTVLGVEIPEAARSAGQLIKTGFAKDFNEAADLIVAGSQSGLNVSEDWLDTVNEYSTQFRKLGVSGPEALGLLSQAVKGGARDTDVAADALKEFSIRAIDGSKSTMGAFHTLGLDFDKTTDAFAKGGPAAHDMFQQVLTGIQSIQDPYTKAQVQIALFGTQAEDLGGALNQLDLSNATKQLGEVDGAAQRASDTLGGNTANSIESAKRNIELAVSNTQSSLADAFGPQIKQFADYVTTHQDDILGFFSAIAGGATEFGAGLAFVVGGAVEAWGTLISAIGDGVGFVIDGFEQLVGGLATVAHAVGADGIGNALDSAKSQLGTLSDGLHAFGEDTTTLGGKIVNTANDLHNLDTSLSSTRGSAEAAKAQIQGVSEALGGLPGGKNIDINAIVVFKDQNGRAIDPSQFGISQRQQSAAQGLEAPVTGRAGGGAIRGPGGPTSDVIPFLGSNGEHVWAADEVNAVGGQDGMYRMRAMAREGLLGKYAGGGALGPDVMAAEDLIGTMYSQGDRTDCSGMAARVISRALGLPEVGLMSTKNAAQWLAARGFQPGLGGPGTISVGWYDHGPGPNDGHMAMTLSNGENAEAGGKNRVFTLGAGAAGADSPQFDQHMFLPNLFGEGPAGTGSFSASGSAGAGGGGTPGVGPNGEAGTYSAPDGKAVREADQKVADADQRVKEAEAKQRELEADAKESQKVKAQADVDKAKREAADARADRDEVMKGKFTPGGGGKGGKGGGPQLSELGSIGKSFLTETFGLDGSWLPDIGNLMPLQIADTLLSAFAPAGGSGGGGVGGPQTSGLPFGIPDVMAPPLPPDGVHTGSGDAPGPGITQNFDLSNNYQGPVGLSPEEIRKQNERAQQRGVARIGGIPMAAGS